MNSTRFLNFPSLLANGYLDSLMNTYKSIPITQNKTKWLSNLPRKGMKRPKNAIFSHSFLQLSKRDLHANDWEKKVQESCGKAWLRPELTTLPLLSLSPLLSPLLSLQRERERMKMMMMKEWVKKSHRNSIP